MKRRSVLAALLGLVAMAVNGSPVEWQVGKTVVTVEFYTPQTVRVVKSPVGHDYQKEGLVVIAQPEDVKVNHNGNSVSSDVMTVRMDPKTGAVTFSAKGKTLLREKSAASFEPRTEGPDKGKFRVTQTFTLDKDEAIYGLGTIQNGKMNRRGEHKLMEHGTTTPAHSSMTMP